MVWLACAAAAPLFAASLSILSPAAMRRHVGNFNRHDHTHFGQAIAPLPAGYARKAREVQMQRDGLPSWGYGYVNKGAIPYRGRDTRIMEKVPTRLRSFTC